MAASADDFQRKLKAIKDGFSKSLPKKIEEINQQIQVWRDHPADNESLNTLHRYTHSLAGSGATFGFTHTSQCSRKIDNYLKELIASKAVCDSAIADKLIVLERELQEAAISELKENAGHGVNVRVVASNPVKPQVAHSSSRVVYLVEDEEYIREQLRVQLNQYNYHVEAFPDIASFARAIETKLPDAVVFDIELPDGNGADYVRSLREKRQFEVPVLFLSSHIDTINRLKAVRCGGISYLEKPVEIGILVDRLDQVTVTIPEEPYRILVVEDTSSILDFIVVSLQSVGMAVDGITDALQVVDHIRDFSPDLILMDLYMPTCNGLEMAQVIRQHEAYLGIPIVYLSGETDLDRQLSAIGAGGDDFLTKPIKPNHLISAVTSRARRARALRSMMMRDSLTGLLNHTTVKDKLETEISRSRRLGNGVVFAMIDIDHFKHVNDTYGHGAGDRVIKSLSRMLTQRLRRSDIVGRYGGEEFAVILLDTDMQQAERIMNEIREAFSAIPHQAEKKSFRVTFSCGLAMFPDYADAAEVCNAADGALYQAKDAGRNIIKVARKA